MSLLWCRAQGEEQGGTKYHYDNTSVCVCVCDVLFYKFHFICHCETDTMMQ